MLRGTMAARAAARGRSGEEKLEIAARTHSGIFAIKKFLKHANVAALMWRSPAARRTDNL
jgi:hypothetical protein